MQMGHFSICRSSSTGIWHAVLLTTCLPTLVTEEKLEECWEFRNLIKHSKHILTVYDNDIYDIWINKYQTEKKCTGNHAELPTRLELKNLKFKHCQACITDKTNDMRKISRLTL